MYNIAVIGCGAIGLTTALEIQRNFGNQAKVIIFADKFSPNTTSDIAAGFWEPYLLAENSEEDVIRWSKETYSYILRLWQEGKKSCYSYYLLLMQLYMTSKFGFSLNCQTVAVRVNLK